MDGEEGHHFQMLCYDAGVSRSRTISRLTVARDNDSHIQNSWFNLTSRRADVFMEKEIQHSEKGWEIREIKSIKRVLTSIFGINYSL